MLEREAAFDLSGRVALVTGGAGLLGVQHARALAEAGARVILGDVNLTNAQARARDLNASAVHLDVTDPASVRAALEQTGGVHILVNNATLDEEAQTGGLVESSRFENFALAQWEREFKVGLTGAFLCSQAFGGWMARHGGGVILNIASELSVFAPDQRIYRKDGLAEDRQPVKPVSNSAIKHGLVGLTRYLATYWATCGVRVNALSLGGVYTSQPEDFVQRLSNLIPLGRMARPEEYRAAVQFLCSDASSYMTGQNVVMDGGRSVW